jgi:hypothetical protein
MKIFLSLLLLFSLSFSNSFKAWDFQTLDEFYKIQEQYIHHKRSRSGNPENYFLTTSITEFYISGGLYVADANGIQTNTNIGNYVEISGDNNQIDQSSGEQTNENTIN